MTDQHAIASADEYADRIIKSPFARNPEFLERIITRVQSHRDRIKSLQPEGTIELEGLPSLRVFGQANTVVYFAPDRFYIVMHKVPTGVQMHEPMITTLRATPASLLEYLREGEHKTDDFLLKVVRADGIIKFDCVEIHIIDQSGTALVQPVQLPKAQLEQTLLEAVKSFA